MPRRFMLKPNLKTVLLGIMLLLVSGSFASLHTAQAGLAKRVSLAAFSPNGLVINEIYDSNNGNNEYFELFNNSQVTIDLSTYVIYNRDDNIPLSNLSNPLINAGQYRAIGSAQLGDWFAGTTGLDRNGDFLGLVNTNPTDTVIDVVNFGSSPNPNWPNYPRFEAHFFTSSIPQLPPAGETRSLQRWPDGKDTDQGTDFASIPSSPSSPSCGDPSEDDNNPTSTTTQPVGSTVLHRLCPAGDVDWVPIQMNTNSTYTLSASAVGSTVDTVLRLFDSSNNLIAEDNSPGSRNSVINFRPTTSGLFRAQITDANNQGGSGPNFLYNFSISSTLVPTSTPTVIATTTASTATPTSIPCNDGYEPDNDRNTAKLIELFSPQRHSLCPAGDQDWVQFQAGGDKVYSLFTSNLTGPIDTVITLYDDRGNFLAENDDAQPGQGLASRLDYTFYGNGNALYYLRVRERTGNGNVGYEYTLNFQSQGGLPPTSTATATFTPNPNSPTPTPGPCSDAYETDGLPTEAKDILIGTTQRHIICPATDADWVKFYARAGKVYTIRTANLGPGLDTYMYLFDSNGTTVLAQNDDGGDGVSSRLDFYPLRDDFYYVQVKNAGDIGGSLQVYDLILAVAPGVPQPPGTATAGPPPPSGSTPTTVVQPTRPPVPSPTAGGIPPTPPAQQTVAVPPLPISTSQPPGGGGSIPPPQPTGQLPPAPTLPVPTEVIVESTMIPNIPRTGHPPESRQVPAKPVIVLPEKPAAVGSSLDYLPVSFRLFYDRNNNSLFNAGEGIRGVSVYFTTEKGDRTALGSLTTSAEGFGVSRLLKDNYRVVVPYFGLDMPLKDFPGRDTHKLWLPSLSLPDRVP
jgi:hypothetical protein